MRGIKPSRKRKTKKLALILCVVAALGLCVITPIFVTNHTISETTTAVSIKQICGADKEEVNLCLPVQ